MRIWRFDEEYIENAIKELDEYINDLERAKSLLERLKGEIDSHEAVEILREVSEILEGVFTELQPLSDSIADLVGKI